MQTVLTGKALVRTLQTIRHWFNRNTRRQARRNIYAHYDIGNAFYSASLDPSMTYSSALFEDGTADLTAAQNNKYRRLVFEDTPQPEIYPPGLGGRSRGVVVSPGSLSNFLGSMAEQVRLAPDY